MGVELETVLAARAKFVRWADFWAIPKEVRAYLADDAVVLVDATGRWTFAYAESDDDIAFVSGGEHASRLSAHDLWRAELIDRETWQAAERLKLQSAEQNRVHKAAMELRAAGWTIEPPVPTPSHRAQLEEG